ncbi:MAG TPA: DUF4249 family protein [Bacteroidales bacterium]
MIKLHNFKRFVFVIGCTGLAFFSSCTESFVMDTGSTYTRLCVEGNITTDTMKHKVRLVKSRDLNDNSPFKPVSDANVTITDGLNVFPLKEDTTDRGSYYTDSTVYGLPGRTYTLDIKNVDINNDGVMEEYMASSKLMGVNPIDSFTIYYNNINEHMKGWSLDLYARDAGGGRNFYLIKARQNGVMLTDSIYKYSFSDNLGFEGKYFNGFQAYYIQETTKTKLKTGDTITLEMSGITEDYYNFIIDYITEYYPKIPIFSGPSANVSTNVEPKNKTMGFFAAYSIQRKTRIYR